MGSYSRIELDIKAKAAVLALIRHIDTDGLVDEICSSYTNFCNSPKAKKITNKYRKITEGVPLRIFFEIVCFTAFLITMETQNYVIIKKIFRKKPDYDSQNYFNNRIAIELCEQCQKIGVNKFDEIELVPHAPDIRIKFGDPLDPMKRLIAYSLSYKIKPEAVKKQFGIWVGKALDPLNYRILQEIWEVYEVVLTTIADKVMADVFLPSVRLNNLSTP